MAPEMRPGSASCALSGPTVEASHGAVSLLDCLSLVQTRPGLTCMAFHQILASTLS